MSFYNGYIQTEVADFAKRVIEKSVRKFILNFFASIHPDYKQLYSDDAKTFLSETFFRVRNISMKHNKVNIWSGRPIVRTLLSLQHDTYIAFRAYQQRHV